MREIIGSIISEVVIRHRRSSGIAPEMLKVDMKLYETLHVKTQEPLAGNHSTNG
jgi:hypothetical protein